MRVSINTITPDIPSAEVIGWAHEIRDLGGLAFLLIRDRTGIIQVTVPKKKVAPEIAETIRAISRESVVRVTGTVKPEGKAPGGRELIPDAIEIVSLSASPLPLDVAEKVPAELDTRLDNRFLDARRPRVRCCSARNPEFLFR